MTVLPICHVGDPVLREPALAVGRDELMSEAIQEFIDDLVETKRAAHGAGLAANQVGRARRIALVEVEPGNPRYPYKPPVPLAVMVNPQIVSASDEQIEISEGCLSVPGLRGTVRRSAEIVVEYVNRDGEPVRRQLAGLTAGSFQHEIDHLNGVLFLDRVTDPRTFSTWDEWERHGRQEFERQARLIVARYGS